MDEFQLTRTVAHQHGGEGGTETARCGGQFHRASSDISNPASVDVTHRPKTTPQ
jgi:hypothetical protein